MMELYYRIVVTDIELFNPRLSTTQVNLQKQARFTNLQQTVVD